MKSASTSALLFFLFLTQAAWAAKKTYEVNLDLTQGGLERKFRITVEEGESGQLQTIVDKEGHFVEVVVTEESLNGKKGLLLDLAVGTVLKNGEKHIFSRPQVFTQENRTAEVSVTHEDGSENLNLSVKAKSKNQAAR